MLTWAMMKRTGRETNDAITSVLRREPELNAQPEKEYMAFCATLNLEVRPTGNFGVSRKFGTLAEPRPVVSQSSPNTC